MLGSGHHRNEPVLGGRVPESDEVEVPEVIQGLAPYEHFVETIEGLLGSP